MSLLKFKNLVDLLRHFWDRCVTAKRLLRILFATSFHFILLAKLNDLLRLYFRSCASHASDFLHCSTA